MDETVAAPAHLVAHFLHVAVAGCRRHQRQGIGEGQVRSHRGILSGIEQFGLRQTFVALDRFVDEAVYAAADAGGRAVCTTDPL